MAAMPEIHESIERLYRAAKDMHGITGQSAVARRLKVSPQVMKNWEKRGLSEGGALAAQKNIGCDANWLLDGDEPTKKRDWIASPNQPTAGVAEDIAVYRAHTFFKHHVLTETKHCV